MADMNSEGMLQQAQHIWQMLDDMAQNDPQAYRRFIDKQVKEGKEAMKPPQPHMCVQTTIIGDCPLYMNICEWNKIPEPKSDEDPIPVTGGHVYEGKDKKGKHKLITIAFNPSVLEQFGRDSALTAERRLLINLAIDYTQDQYKLKLSRSFTILPNDTLFKGPKEKVKSTLLDKFGGGKTAADKQFENELSELEKSFGPLATGCKESLLKEMSDISLGSQADSDAKSYGTQSGISLLSSDQSPKVNKKGLIEEVSSTENKLDEPEYSLQVHEKDEGFPRRILLRINLPGIKSVRDCDLEISEDDVHLEAGDKYELKLVLPERVSEQLASAKFSKKSSTLTLTLPVS